MLADNNLRMKHSLIIFLLIPYLIFISCGGFLETYETDEEYYSHNPHCTFFFQNQSDRMVYVRVDCRYNKDNIIKWIREGWAKEIKMHSADSLYVSATGTNKKRPTWLDLLNNKGRDSVVVSVFDTLEKAVRYDAEDRKIKVLKQYFFATKDLGEENQKELIFR